MAINEQRGGERELVGLFNKTSTQATRNVVRSTDRDSNRFVHEILLSVVVLVKFHSVTNINIDNRPDRKRH